MIPEYTGSQPAKVIKTQVHGLGSRFKEDTVRTDSTIGLLLEKHAELYSQMPVTWKRPVRASRNPLRATPLKSWPDWNLTFVGIPKNVPTWLYADLNIPRRHRGLDLRNTDIGLFLHGWCPFTMWLDGEELFKEEHAWHASGPIAEPVPLAQGRHRLVMCITPTETPTTPAPLSVFVRPMACVEMAIHMSAAAGQLRLAQTLAGTTTQRRLVQRAAAAVDTDALARSDWPVVLASIARMEEILSPLSEQARELTVRLLGHSHIDMDWMWTWPDTVHCIRRDFRSVTDLMDDYPGLTFAISQVPSYDVVRKMDPAVFRKVRARVAEGRWEAVVGTWTEGDLHMADGESIARHMLYATDWTRRHLGSKTNVLWEPDTFGHPANMPQLARHGELEYYFHMRTNPGRENNWPVRRWEGLDGTDIEAVSMSYNGDLQPMSVIGTALSHLRSGFRDSLHIWGLGNHGGAMSRYWLKLLDIYRHKPLIPTIEFGTLNDHMRAVRRSGARLPSNRGETFSLFEGCWTTHAHMKRSNRMCESALLTAETMSALAGLDRNDELRECWSRVLFNHFHDLMDGCSVKDSYTDSCARFRKSLKGAERVSREALGRFVTPVSRGKTLVVVNQLAFLRTGPVRVRLPASTTHLLDDEGASIPVQRIGKDFMFIARDIPAFSSRSYRIQTGSRGASALPPVAVSDDRRQGAKHMHYRVETVHAVSQLSKDSGAISAYYDKRLCREFVAHGVPRHMAHVEAARRDLALNVFQVCDESPNDMSAWLIHNIVRQENLLRGAEVSLLETGPVFARFRVSHRFRSSTIREDVIYYNDLPQVDFETMIDWREKGSPEQGVPQLKVSFAGTHSGSIARFEGPFCITERPADGQEQPTQKWVDASGSECGFAILNDGRYGCDVLGSRIRLTILRNSYGPDEESDNGVHTVRFAFVPHGPRTPASELTRQATVFNRPPLTALANRPAAGLPPGLRMTGGGSVLCTCLRRAEHSDGTILRLFEADGRRARVSVQLGNGIRTAREVNFLENPVRKCRTSKGAVRLSFRPYEVKTLLLHTRK